LNQIAQAALNYEPMMCILESYQQKHRLWRMCQRVARKAGVEGFGAHALRHRFATELLKKGVTLYKISKILGHASVKQTEDYLHLNRDDIFYYEFIDNRPEFARPGIILRGPASQQKITSPEAPAISNGRNLTLSQARNAVNFRPVAPPRLHPGYILDKIRKIENRNSLHLLYTNGINALSLFEQPLEGEHRLGAQDFREFAVYQSMGQAGGTILAWSDGALSYVLIGNAEMSRLMEMAQSISATGIVE